MAETASQIETPVQDAPVTVVVDASAQVEQAVRKLLKVFHVCMKYGSITGQPLPANVDFFGKTLLGQTSIAGFDVALEGSLRTLGIYLNVSLRCVLWCGTADALLRILHFVWTSIAADHDLF